MPTSKNCTASDHPWTGQKQIDFKPTHHFRTKLIFSVNFKRVVGGGGGDWDHGRRISKSCFQIGLRGDVEEGGQMEILLELHLEFDH